MFRTFLRRWLNRTTTPRPASRRSPLRLETLDERLMLSVSPISPAFDVTPHGAVAPPFQASAGNPAPGVGDRMVARASNGNFVVLEMPLQPGGTDSQGIFYKVYSGSGLLLAARQIDGTNHFDCQATVAMDAFGDFAIAWVHKEGDPGALYTHRYDRNGNPLGHIAVVASGGLDSNSPSIALNDNGWLAVSYLQHNNTVITGQGTNQDVYLTLWTQAAVDQRGSWVSITGPDQANGRDPFISKKATIALNDNNEGVLAFAQVGEAGGPDSPALLTFDPITGKSTLLSTATNNAPGGPNNVLGLSVFADSVAINSSGSIVATWSTTTSDGHVQVWAERHGQDGTLLGDQLVLQTGLKPNFGPSYSAGSVSSVAIDAQGNFMVAATQNVLSGGPNGQPVSQAVTAQVFDPTGKALTSPLTVNPIAQGDTTHTETSPCVAVDGAGNFVVEFLDSTAAGYGRMARLYRAGNAESFAVAEIAGAGVWRYSSLSGWKQLTPANASQVGVDGRGDVVAEIPGAGVWRYEDGLPGSHWQQLTPADASQVSIAGKGNVVAEIPGAGVWRFRDTTGWQQLTPANASLVGIDGNADVVAEIPGAGVWRYLEGAGGNPWQQLTPADASALAISGTGFVAVEIAGAGVWRFEDSTGWKQLTVGNASALALNDNGTVAAAFQGAGVWRYQDSAGWLPLGGADATAVGLDDTDAVFANLVGGGIQRYQDAWTQLSPAQASSLAAAGG
jgi:hypothetical protein